MIHFIITVQGGLPPTVTIQEFATANNTKDAETIARLIRTSIPPWLQKTATGNDARYRSLVATERGSAGTAPPKRKAGRPRKEPR